MIPHTYAYVYSAYQTDTPSRLLPLVSWCSSIELPRGGMGAPPPPFGVLTPRPPTLENQSPIPRVVLLSVSLHWVVLPETEQVGGVDRL